MITPSNQQQQPYLPTSKPFPVQNPVQLEPQLVKTYIEIAQAVNLRTIGIFDEIQVVTGERWFADSLVNAALKRQSYRKAFTFGAIASGATLTIDHGLTNITAFTRIYGTCITDAPDYRPLPYASVTVNANIELNVTSTQIVISNGAASPNIVSGIVILEYLLN